jgi:hypothetical protein
MTPSNIARSYITPPAIHGRSSGNIVHIVLNLRSGLFVLLTALGAASQGACGSGAAKEGDASTSDGLVTIDSRVLPDTGPAIDAAHPGDFIAADVDGVTVRAELTPTCGTKGANPGEIWVNAGTTSPTLGWTLYVPNSVGTSGCIPDWVALFEAGRMLRSDRGSCTVTVTAAAPALGDALEGTFTATLTTLTSPVETAIVTNGAFHVTRNFE